MSTNPVSEMIESLEKQVQDLEQEIAELEATSDLEDVFESLKSFCNACTIKGEKKCMFCYLYKHYVGK